MANLDAYPVLEAGVMGRILDPTEHGGLEAVVVLPARGKIDILNEVGARIWSMVDGRRSVREIAAAIADEYQVSMAQAEADALTFLEDLASRGAITFKKKPQH